jgi:phytoene/squalene synthetase
LYLGECAQEPLIALSDSICTGLQLANFWQDVARDWDKGRIYLPRETAERFGCGNQPWTERRATSEFRAALAYEVERAERYLLDGLPLVERVAPALRGDVWLFVQGGLRILKHIRAQQFDVWSRRPKVTKLEQLGLLAGCVWRNTFRRGGQRK